MSKLFIILALLLITVGNGLTTIVGIATDDYSQVAFNGASSFLFFHLAVMVMKIGLQPWRVVPTFFLISGIHGASAIDYACDAQWLNAFGQTVVCVVWAVAAQKANKTRLLLKAEEK